MTGPPEAGNASGYRVAQSSGKSKGEMAFGPGVWRCVDGEFVFAKKEATRKREKVTAKR